MNLTFHLNRKNIHLLTIKFEFNRDFESFLDTFIATKNISEVE